MSRWLRRVANAAAADQFMAREPGGPAWNDSVEPVLPRSVSLPPGPVKRGPSFSPDFKKGGKR